MNERPIRIVTSEQQGVNTVYQMGARLPQPAPFPEEPLVIVDIDEYDDDEDGENDVAIILSVGEPESEYHTNNIGFMTRIPSNLIVRRDSVVTATEVVEALAEKARQLRADADAEAEAEAQEAEAGVAEEAQVEAMPAQAPEAAQAPDQQPQPVAQGVPNVENGGV